MDQVLNNSEVMAALFEHCITYSNKKQQYTEGNRNNYIYYLANNCRRRKMNLDLVIRLCRRRFDLPIEELEETIKSAFKNSDKEKPQKKRTTNVHLIESFLKARYQFRFNEITNRIEFCRIDSRQFKDMTDLEENTIFCEILKSGIKCGMSKMRAVIYSNFSSAYNPFKEYFESLPVWEDKRDYIELLGNTVKTTTQQLWQKFFKKWVVASVASALNDAVVNHTILILQGPQGIGKTTWLMNLVPTELRKYVFCGTVKPADKDTIINLSECFVIILDELENLNRSELGSFKEIVTKPAIRIRAPYGRHSETRVRRANFAGSVNNKQFLTDTTGSRRFLTFEALEISNQHGIDLKMVFAQGLFLLNQDFKFWLDPEETEQISLHNEQFIFKTSEEEMLLKYYKNMDDSLKPQYLMTTEIAQQLSEKCRLAVNNSVIRARGSALHKNKFERIKRKNRYVYAVYSRSVEEIDMDMKESGETN